MLTVMEEWCVPTKGTKYSACIDLMAREDTVICNGEIKIVGLGVSIDDSLDEEFKKSHYMQLMVRSSLCKQGLIAPHGVGIIDLDYSDEIKIPIYNTSDTIEIKAGDRIAQIAIMEHKTYMFGICTDIKRSGGFGSTS